METGIIERLHAALTEARGRGFTPLRWILTKEDRDSLLIQAQISGWVSYSSAVPMNLDGFLGLPIRPVETGGMRSSLECAVYLARVGV